MPDVSHDQKVYKPQGADELVIASGGTITVESGGALANAGTITNTGTFTNTGTLNAGTISETVTIADTAVALGNSGIAVFGSTTAGVLAYTLVAPTAGITKTLVARESTGGLTLVAAAGVSLNYAGNRKATFADADEVLILRGISATQWAVTGITTGVTLGAT